MHESLLTEFPMQLTISWLFAEITFVGGFSCVTQQTCLLYDTADVSAVSHGRQSLLGHTAGMSTASHSRQFCCVTHQTCLLCHTAGTSAVSHSKHFCCVTQHTCLLCNTADISVLSHITKHTCQLCDTAAMSVHTAERSPVSPDCMPKQN